MENNSLDLLTPVICWSMAILGFIWTVVYAYLKFKKRPEYLKVRRWWVRIELTLFITWIVWYIIQLIIQYK